MSGITREEWLRALDEANIPSGSADDPSALTVYEYMELMGLSLETAARQLERLVKAGKAERVSKRKLAPDGVRTWNYKAYRLTCVAGAVTDSGST